MAGEPLTNSASKGLFTGIGRGLLRVWLVSGLLGLGTTAALEKEKGLHELDLEPALARGSSDGRTGDSSPSHTGLMAAVSAARDLPSQRMPSFRPIDNETPEESNVATKLNSLQDLFVEELRDLYSAETQLVKALPKMAKAASAEELRSAFEEHLEQTKGHVERLEQIITELGEKPKGKTCKAMEGLVAEGEELIHEKPKASVLDAGLISAAQRVEHYEIAGYGSVRTYAKLLGNNKVAEILQTTLDEEGETDKKLTRLAERLINVQAV